MLLCGIKKDDVPMNKKEFSLIRKRLGKTQKQIATLLGTSVKAVHSYEQGWRRVPPHVERQLFFLVSRLKRNRNDQKACWVTKRCAPELKRACPAWEFKAGNLCWFINGTVCKGEARKDWHEKIKICRSCDVLSSFLKSSEPVGEPASSEAVGR